MKSKRWSKELPKEEGWYWVRHRTKHGVSICPASFMRFKRSKEWVIHTTGNSLICSHTPDRTLRFGPKIEIPKYP